MSVPCTISEAIEILEEREKQTPASASSSVNNNTAPVDILAIIVNHSILQSPPAAASSFVPKAELWISDQSVPSDITARITLSGSMEIARVAEEQIATGDVVRFNRVSLSKNSTKSSVRFLFLWNDPEPGIRWFRLGHIDSTAAWISEEDTRRTPESMVTPENRISELVQWFQKCRNENGQSHSSSLAPLPVQRRSLNEIQSSTGLLSNVTVRVTHCDYQRLPQSSSTNNKRKRGGIASPSSIGYATLTDGSGVTIPLVDPGNRFESNLRTAKDTGRLLMLTNLLSKSRNDVHGRTLPLDEVVLVPTRSTVAVLLSNINSIGTNGETFSLPEPSETISPRSEITLLSSILDMSINGASLRDSRSLESTRSFLETILLSDGEYRSATLHLECSLSIGQLGDTIHADSRVVKTLCGGIEAGELMKDESLGCHVLHLVRALLNEPILLRWTINTRQNQAEVLKVVLPKL
jgi:hypothetical protein